MGHASEHNPKIGREGPLVGGVPAKGSDSASIRSIPKISSESPPLPGCPFAELVPGAS